MGTLEYLIRTHVADSLADCYMKRGKLVIHIYRDGIVRGAAWHSCKRLMKKSIRDAYISGDLKVAWPDLGHIAIYLVKRPLKIGGFGHHKIEN